MNAETRKRLVAARSYGGFTSREQLAHALGTSKDTLWRIETGQRDWRPLEDEHGFLIRIADACGLPYEFFTADFARLKEIAEYEQPPNHENPP